jgi:hypothetical protein
MWEEGMYILQTGIGIFLYILAFWIEGSQVFLHSTDFPWFEVLVCKFIALSHRHDELLQVKALFIKRFFHLVFLLFHPLSLLRGLILVTQHGANELQFRIHLLALLEGCIHFFMVMQS